MTLILRPRIEPREFILGFGVQGTGKSSGLLSIARRCPTDRFYVADNDYAYARLLATEFRDLTNVHYDEISEWDEYKTWVRDIAMTVKPNDWVSLDSTSDTWPAVQNWFVEQIHGGDDMADYFMEVRKEKQARDKKAKALGAFEGFMDWPVINQQYTRKLYIPFRTIPCHKWMTAELARLGDDDDKDVKALFGPYGVKPAGQKRLGHIPQTVLLMTKSRVGQYALTTIKDRGRRELEDEPVEDFAKDYLMKVAGWRPTKGEGEG